MKAVKVRELFGFIPDTEYKGESDVFTYGGELYMTLEDAYDCRYVIRDEWIEDIKYEIV